MTDPSSRSDSPSLADLLGDDPAPLFPATNSGANTPGADVPVTVPEVTAALAEAAAVLAQAAVALDEDRMPALQALEPWVELACRALPRLPAADRAAAVAELEGLLYDLEQIEARLINRFGPRPEPASPPTPDPYRAAPGRGPRSGGEEV